MNDFQQYMLAKSEKEKAYEQYNYASCNLKNAQIMERLAEIKSQHQPLSGLIDGTEEEYLKMRDKLYAAAFYVVVGRMP